MELRPDTDHKDIEYWDKISSIGSLNLKHISISFQNPISIQSIKKKKKKKDRKKILLSKCSRKPLAELSGLLQPFTEDDISLSSLLSAMDLLSSLALSPDNWPTLFVTAYSVSVAVKCYN